MSRRTDTSKFTCVRDHLPGSALFQGPAIVTMAPALDAVGVPIAGLTIVLGIDRIPDMIRSGVNILGQASAAVLVDRWAGGKNGTNE